MKLKTIKDLASLKEFDMDCEKQPLNHRCLKIHAINWIKELREASSKSGSFEPPVGLEDFGASYDGEVGNVVRWIKNFFDLTDEDVLVGEGVA